MTSKDIQERLSIKLDSHDHHLENRFIFDKDWESDYFTMTKSGYAVEYEIKISRQDFKADFMKFKHKLFENIKEKTVIKEFDNSKSKRKWTRRPINIDVASSKIPNKFYFVCPKGLLSADDVPSYAGLMHVNPEGSMHHCVDIIKQAPFIHKDKHNVKDLLFSKYHWGYINYFIAIKKLKKSNKDLKKKGLASQEKIDKILSHVESVLNLPANTITNLTTLKKNLKK